MFERPHKQMRRATIVVVALVVAASLVAPAARAERMVHISGGGFGHGIGMSQYGAYGRAKRGDGYREILSHYYKRTSLQTVDIPPLIRVGLSQGREALTLSSKAFKDGGGKGAWKVAGRDSRLAAGPAGTQWRVEASPTGGMRFFKNDERVQRGSQNVWGAPDEPLTFLYESFGSLAHVDAKNNDFAYGRMELSTYASSSCGEGYCMRLVVSLPMQKYLYGLGEVPSSWPQDALRTQAVAGRTYALDKIARSGQHRSPCDCAVFDSVLDQAYIGDAKRTGSGQYWDDWKAAVDETEGEAVLYEGAPIQALYSSTSGGYTENNENVWGGTPIPYLRGVPDKPDKISPYHTWNVEMPYSEFENKLDAAYDTGELIDFELVPPFGVSGRVTVDRGSEGGARITGSETTQPVRTSGWNLRSVFSLRDTLFRVDIDEPVADRFRRRYRMLDGAPGRPKSPAYPVPRHSKKKGTAQDFAHGRMTYTRATKRIAWQWGPVLGRYDAMRRERSPIGMPASDVWGASKYRGATYTRGIIVWVRATERTYVVRGDFYKAYRRNGGVKGRLGLPAKDRASSKSLPRDGMEQRFARGTLYMNPDDDKVHALWGPIDERFRSLGGARSNCGYPVGDLEMDEGRAVARFERGHITWTEGGGAEVAC